MTLRRWAWAGIVAGTLAVATPAWSQTYVGVQPPVVAPEPAVQRSVAAPPAPAARGNLALTGADVLEMVAIGAFGMSAGAVTIRVTRTRSKPVLA